MLWLLHLMTTTFIFGIFVMAACKENFIVLLCKSAIILLSRKPSQSMHSIAGATQVKWAKNDDYTLATSHEGDVRIWDKRVSLSSFNYIQCFNGNGDCYRKAIPQFTILQLTFLKLTESTGILFQVDNSLPALKMAISR